MLKLVVDNVNIHCNSAGLNNRHMLSRVFSFFFFILEFFFAVSSYVKLHHLDTILSLEALLSSVYTYLR